MPGADLQKNAGRKDHTAGLSYWKLKKKHKLHRCAIRLVFNAHLCGSTVSQQRKLPSGRVVICVCGTFHRGVYSTPAQIQVDRTIVQFVAVPVAHNLPGPEASSELLFGNPAMYQHARVTKTFVTLVVNVGAIHKIGVYAIVGNKRYATAGTGENTPIQPCSRP